MIRQYVFPAYANISGQCLRGTEKKRIYLSNIRKRPCLFKRPIQMNDLILLVNPILAGWLKGLENAQPITSLQCYEDWKNSVSARPLAGLKIVVQLELSWEAEHYSRFRGLNVIQEIRRDKGWRYPVIATSLLPKVGFTGPEGYKSREEFRILRDPSITFLPFDELMGAMRTSGLEPLFPQPIEDEFLFIDICESLYDRRGYLGEFFHELFNTIPGLLETEAPESISRFIFQRFNDLPRIFPDYRQELAEMLRKFEKQFPPAGAEEKEHHYLPFLHVMQKEAIKILSAESIPAYSAQPRAIHTAYLDDNAENRNKLKGILGKYNIECREAAGPEELLAILEQDKHIRTIMCNYRFKAPNGQYSREQGYHVWQKVSERFPGRKFFFLTGIYDSFLPRFMREINALCFSKQEVFDPDNPEKLYFLIKTLIEEHARLANSPPTPFGFTRHLSELYVRYINHPDYYKWEKEANEIAWQFVEGLLREGEAPAYDKLVLHPKIKESSGEKALKAFRRILVNRRVFLSLCQLPQVRNGDFGYKELYSIMRMGFPETEEKERYARDRVFTVMRIGQKKHISAYFQENADGSILLEEEMRALRTMAEKIGRNNRQGP